MAVSRGPFSYTTGTIKEPSIELMCWWISPEVMLKGYKKCCISYEILDVEEDWNVDNEHESMNSECETEDGNC
jgi:hypothetical protein